MLSSQPSTGVLPLIAIGTPANGAASPGTTRVGLGQRALAVDLDERVERRIERLDPPQRGLHDLTRASHRRCARARRSLRRTRTRGRPRRIRTLPTSLLRPNASARESPGRARTVARGRPRARGRHQRRADPGRPDRHLRHRPAHLPLGRLGAEDDPGADGGRARVRRRDRRGRLERHRLPARRHRQRRGPRGLRALPQLPGRPPAPVRGHRGRRRRPRPARSPSTSRCR